MGLTELQLPTKETFYGRIQSVANQMNNLMKQWEDLDEFIGMIEVPGDLDAMGVAVGQVRADLADFRTMLEEVVDFYNGTSTTQTVTPADVIDTIRSI